MRIRAFVFLMMSALASVCFAQQVSEEQAYETALQFLAGGQSAQKAPARNSEQPLTLTYKAQTNKDNDLYVFNREGGGFVIVSADARTVKPVLGYSDSGSFDADNMPPALQDILSQYQEEINYARENVDPQEGVLQSVNSIGTPVVGPLIKTKWDQVAPYNGLCPMDIDRFSYTGCGATAMAQIMNYWRWPERGYGSHKNMYVDSLFVDFSQSVYDWDNMAMTYTVDTPQFKIDAVQRLMYDCGIAIDMEYSQDGSYSWLFDVPQALVCYFNYKQEVEYLWRDYYETQWDSIIAAELDAGRPVAYGGSGNIGTHFFVCDGYDSEYYFHFNLGWGGYFDGYYLTTTIDIDDRNITFDNNQEAVIGIYPDYDDQDSNIYIKYYHDDENEDNFVLCDYKYPADADDFIIPDSISIDDVIYPVKSINELAFINDGLGCFKNVITSQVLENIGSYAFSKNVNLSSVYISESVKKIGYSPFCGNQKLRTIIVDESNPYYYSPKGSNVIIERSSGRLVQGCNYSVIPEQGVTAIGYNAFEDFDSITEIRLPESVITLEFEAFIDCSNLKTVYLGSQLQTIERDVFCGCISLTDVYFYSDAAPMIGPTDEDWGPSIPYSCTIHVKPSALESFKANEILSTYTIVPDVPETTTATPSVRTDDDIEPQYYDLLGRPVQKDYKGLKIGRNGKQM